MKAAKNKGRTVRLAALIGIILVALLAMLAVNNAPEARADNEIASCYAQGHSNTTTGIGNSVDKMPIGCRTASMSGYRNFRVTVVAQGHTNLTMYTVKVWYGCGDGYGDVDTSNSGEWTLNVGDDGRTYSESYHIFTGSGNSHCDLRTAVYPVGSWAAGHDGFVQMKVFGDN